jgi:hypothetical protein
LARSDHSDELGEDAAQLDRHAVGLHVDLGREVEGQAAVDVALMEAEVLVDDLALERHRFGQPVLVASVVQHSVNAPGVSIS